MIKIPLVGIFLYLSFRFSIFFNFNLYDMVNLTYTAQGTFDHNRNAIINVCIPPQSVGNSYRTELHNLSKITSDGSLNVIFCHFRDGSLLPRQHQGFDYRLKLRLDSLIDHSQCVDFDENNTDALFIFFHSESFEHCDRNRYFKNSEDIYEEIKNNRIHSQEVFKTNATFSDPQKVGVSLLTKLQY